MFQPLAGLTSLREDSGLREASEVLPSAAENHMSSQCGVVHGETFHFPTGNGNGDGDDDDGDDNDDGGGGSGGNDDVVHPSSLGTSMSALSFFFQVDSNLCQADRRLARTEAFLIQGWGCKASQAAAQPACFRSDGMAILQTAVEIELCRLSVRQRLEKITGLQEGKLVLFGTAQLLVLLLAAVGHHHGFLCPDCQAFIVF
ncbi:hypothetical protein U0070_026744 [Myodes glareolus]|uniref:Uncharacterized protein n=1 Tax=Myodes glareolus TaxID=447135 RepID=A0AAW0HXI9_MYOGA